MLRRGTATRSQSLLALSEWQEKESRNQLQSAVDEDGSLLDNLTLELRVHPPSINIDNNAHERWTTVTIDSANRPGSLIYIVQHFTELDLRITSARISSDGGWFVDVFHLCEANGEKVRNPKKLQSIKQMLNVYMQQDEDLVLNGDETDDMNRIETTVFELAGPDRPGLLAEVTHLLTHNGCNVRSAAVWTYRGRVAFVLSVTEKGLPVVDGIKLQRLRQLVLGIMTRRYCGGTAADSNGALSTTYAGSGGGGATALPGSSPGSSFGGSSTSTASGISNNGTAPGASLYAGATLAPGGVIVAIRKVRGEVHHDRRLHQLMLQEEITQWSQGLRLQSVDENGPVEPTTSGISEQTAVSAPDGAQRQDLLQLEEPGAGSSTATSGIVSAASGATSGTASVTPQHPQPKPERAPSTHSVASDSSGVSGASGEGSTPFGAPAVQQQQPQHEEGCQAVAVVTKGPPLAYRSPKHDRPHIDIDYSGDTKYWIISIRCRDRTKLLFDTVCTLADLAYDIYHATIDACEDGTAQQEYYARPRAGDLGFDRPAAEMLRAMLESSIQRRFPKGLKVHVHSTDRFGCLAELTRVLHKTGLSVTRAKVRTYATSKSAGHTFYVMDARGGPPDKSRVEAACREIGGQLVEAGQEARSSSLGGHRFSFSFLARNWNSAWGGSPNQSSAGSI